MKTVKVYNLPLNLLKHKWQQHEKNKHCAIYQVCAVTVKAKQSAVEYGHRLCLICLSDKLTFDLLTLKAESESRVTWATSVWILVFLGLSVLDLGPMYESDVRQTSDSIIALCPAYWVRGISGASNRGGVGNCRDCPLATPVIQAIWAERAGKVAHRGQLIIIIITILY